MVKQVKVIVEKYPDGDVAYPLGLKGVIVGEGGTYGDVRCCMFPQSRAFDTAVM